MFSKLLLVATIAISHLTSAKTLVQSMVSANQCPQDPNSASYNFNAHTDCITYEVNSLKTGYAAKDALVNDIQISSLTSQLNTAKDSLTTCETDLGEFQTWSIVYHNGAFQLFQGKGAETRKKYNDLGSPYAKVLINGKGKIMAVYGGEYRWACMGNAYDKNLVTPAYYPGKWTSIGPDTKQFNSEAEARADYNSISSAYAKALIGADGAVELSYGSSPWREMVIGRYYDLFFPAQAMSVAL